MTPERVEIGPCVLYRGDCREVLPTLDPASVDSIVTDPPAGIFFMGREWDSDRGGRDQWVAFMSEVAAECLRVAKPGAHALVWAIPRTSHWTATAWESAGWEVRDRVSHLFGSGFPKSHNLDGEWDGWGTALKPACEDWWLLRKPLVGTVAQNVQRHGCGALNIDAARIGTGEDRATGGAPHKRASQSIGGGWANDRQRATGGRWPANVTHDGSAEVLEAFAAFGEKGNLNTYGGKRTNDRSKYGRFTGDAGFCPPAFDAPGTAARFFYAAKASKADRNYGLPDGETNGHPTVKPLALTSYLCRLITPPGGTVLTPFLGSGSELVGAALEGFSGVGIEQDADSFATAVRRIRRAVSDSRSLLPLEVA